MAPFVVLCIVLLHPAQALALLGLGDEPARWALERRQPGLPRGYLLAFAGGALLLVGLPFGREAWRAARAARLHA